MVYHYIKLFFRNIKKNKTTFFINVVGLSVGLACVLLIYFWVQSEMNIDKFHQNEPRLVQILQNEPTPNGVITEDYTPGPLAEALKQEIPEIDQSVSLVPNEWFEGEKLIVSDGGERFFVSEIQFASEDFFNVFSYDLVYGNKSEVLANSTSVAISQEMAKKLFDTYDVVGKTVEWIHEDFGGTYLISGVFKAPPISSTMQFDAVFSYRTFLNDNEDLEGWDNSDPYTYATVAANTDIDALNDKIKNFIWTKNSSSEETIFAQKYSEKYLYGKYENGQVTGGRIDNIKLFLIIAALILIIACVNFVNLSTAQASTRIREIGVKKSMGVFRKNLIAQFMTESIIMAFIALVIALLLVKLFLPQFSYLIGNEVLISLDLGFILSIVSIALITGIIAGFYPALVLSRFSPVSALKGELLKNDLSGQFIQKGLVVFQFTMSVALILSVIVIYNQIDLIQNKDLGYENDSVISFTKGIPKTYEENEDGMSEEEIDYFLQILRNIPGVTKASNYAYFIDDFGTTTDVSWPGKNMLDEALFGNIAAGYDFIETTQMEMKAGRSYSKDFQTDKEKIIFNEAAIEQMGLENPVGKVVSLWGENYEIVGVVENFHFEVLYEKIKPLFIKLTPGSFASNFVVKVDSENEVATIDRVKKAYEDYFISGMPFEFSFLDEKNQKLYEQEIRASTLSKYSAAMAIFISCIGLFGLAIFTMERRQKEIGIRKALGQSKNQIVLLLSKEFVKLVLISVVIGLPIAYLFMRNWLSSFSYKINLEPWYFIISGVAVLIVALLTVSIQAITAASKNPVDALRDE